MPQQAPPSRRRPTASERRARELSYHTRKCSICRHPRRREIEQAFLDWGSISAITIEFHLPGRTALYRHVRAVGLLANRNRGLRGALARIIAKAETVKPDAMAVVRAVELFARINDEGEWIGPKRSRPTGSPAEPGDGDKGRRSRSAKTFQFRSLHVRVEHDATC